MVGAFDGLAWDNHLEWWKGAGEIAPGCRIDLHVEAPNDPASLQAAIARAVPALERLRASEPTVRLAVAAQMTSAHNDYCAPEDEVTEEQFAKRLRLLSAMFEASQTVELVYDDGMLFGGHWIIVPVGRDGAVGEAHEAG